MPFYLGWQDLLPIPPDVADANRIFLLPDPASKPSDLYTVQLNRCSVPGYRFVRYSNPGEILMFVDGSSLNNGSPNARAGYGVVFAPLEWSSPISGRLEQDGHPQTSNRAELRAVLASESLTLRYWAREGSPVANQDLWKKLEGKLREMEKKGMLVKFWKIPREWNEADEYAKAGAVYFLFFIFE